MSKKSDDTDVRSELRIAVSESIRTTKRVYSNVFRRSTIEAGLLEKIVLYLLVGLVMFISLFPYYWMFVTSVAPPEVLYSPPPSLIPEEVSLDTYRQLFAAEITFVTYFINSLFVATVSSALAVGIATFGAYSFARLEYPGRSLLSRGVLGSYMISGILMVVPIFQIVVWLGLVDTLTSLIATHFIFTIPLGLYLLGNYFRSIPHEIEEAAMIDGYSRFEVITRITVPMSIPAIIAVYLYSFMLSWNEYLYAVIFIQSQEKYTLPIGIEFLQFEFDFVWGEVMAASLLMTIPIIIMFLYLEEYMVEGLDFGSMD